MHLHLYIEIIFPFDIRLMLIRIYTYDLINIIMICHLCSAPVSTQHIYFQTYSNTVFTSLNAMVSGKRPVPYWCVTNFLSFELLSLLNNKENVFFYMQTEFYNNIPYSALLVVRTRKQEPCRKGKGTLIFQFHSVYRGYIYLS